MMLSPADIGVIFLVAILCAAVVGMLGTGLLFLARRRSLRLRLAVLVGTALASVLAGMIAISAAMYLSEHDLGVFLTVSAASLVSALAVSWVLGRLVAREYDHLTRLTAEVGAGHRLGHSDAEGANGAKGERKDTSEAAALRAELVATSERLADARDEVAALDRSRRELIAWIAHDLRTPMAGLKAMAEALEDGMVDDPDRYHARMVVQVDRLSRMVDDLFALSRIQAGGLELEIAEVSLYDLVSDTVADLRPVAEAKAITVSARGLDDLVVSGDPGELTRVVENLVVNALQHSPEGAEVALETSRTADGQAVLTVTDTGGGIPEEALTEVFATGWRGSPARPADEDVLTGGAGLGLAIVRGIVEAHAGTVGVTNTEAGARFEVRLPAGAPG